MALPNLTYQQAFNGSLLLITIQIIISSAEYLTIKSILKPSGLLSWQLIRLSKPKLAGFFKRSKIEYIMKYPAFIGVLVSRIFLSLVIISAVVLGYDTTLYLIILTLISLITTVRCSGGSNGADQMAMIILLSLTLTKLFDSPWANSIVLFFIAAQASLAYGTAGLLKASKKGWHDGSYVTDMLKTVTFGNRYLGQHFERRRAIAVITSNMVFYGDILLSTAIFCPPQICLCLLIFGVLLHLGIGIVMGLNTFIWSFCATYPAIYFVSNSLYHIL